MEQSCPDSPWYELNYNGNYVSVSRHGDEIQAIDPGGGPYITPGSIIAGFHNNSTLEKDDTQGQEEGDSSDTRK